jgi:phosphoglycerol geranylgeranyltransferase
MYKNRRNIWDEISSAGKQIAVLLDPEKITLNDTFLVHLRNIEAAGVSLLFVGGSTVTTEQQQQCISYLKANSSLPLVIFPGSPDQIVDGADAILLLNLISGRNPDFLIGHHVAAAQKLHQMDLEIIPTAYVLVDGGRETAVQRVSQTSPIPQNDFDLLLSTALAGVMIGNQLVYLDAGSGAEQSVPKDWIAKLSQEIHVPIIVGGGIRDVSRIEQFFAAGADVVVIGNHVESNPEFLGEINRYLVSKI